MKICLINPPRLMRLMSAAMKPAPPLGLAFIAAALRENGHDVQVIDCLAEASDNYYLYKDGIICNGLSNAQTLSLIKEGTEIIGLSIMFSGNWIQNRELIDYLGENLKDVAIIAGGEHITSAPELCINQTKHLKACVIGEGEETVVELVNAIKENEDLQNVKGIVFRGNDHKPINNTRRSRKKDIESIAKPAWELFPVEKYRENSIILGVDRGVISLPLLATRGCPYSCTFCSSPQMWGTKYYMRSVEDVANEIEYFYYSLGARNFDFYDLTAIIKKEWIIEFCKELLARNLPDLVWQIPAGTRSEAIDKEVAYWLYKSGCRNITYAPESGSKETLKLIKKKVNLDNMLRSIEHSYSEGMNIKINFIIGFPNEKHKNIWESILFLIRASKAGVNDMAPSIFSPYPGSELFNKLCAEGKIDIYKDDYFIEIINVDTFFENSFYNSNIDIRVLRFYLFVYLFVFYASNFIFHPSRLVRTIRNMVTKKYESRGEMALGELIKRSRIKINKSDVIEESYSAVGIDVK